MVHLDMFDINTTKKMLVAEHSTIMHRLVFHKVYRDACDSGFYMIDRKAQVAEFVESDVAKNEDGEVMWVDYIPTRETIHRFAPLANYTVRIFND